MDRELEEQIDEVVNKTIKDLKLKISKLVVKNQNKILKEQAKELKTNGLQTSRKTNPPAPVRKNSNKESKRESHKKSYKDDSDSDSKGDYSS